VTSTIFLFVVPQLKQPSNQKNVGKQKQCNSDHTAIVQKPDVLIVSDGTSLEEACKEMIAGSHALAQKTVVATEIFETRQPDNAASTKSHTLRQLDSRHLTIDVYRLKYALLHGRELP